MFFICCCVFVELGGTTLGVATLGGAEGCLDGLAGGRSSSPAFRNASLLCVLVSILGSLGATGLASSLGW